MDPRAFKAYIGLRPMIVIFTDLDGTFLDTRSYSWEAALPAVELLAARDIPWIMVSSKTRAEIEKLRSLTGNRHPFVVENGGAAFIPIGYFGGAIDGAVIRDGYEVLEWGARYPDLVAALRAESVAADCPVSGFHAMSIEELSRLTGLPPDDALLASRREYDEAFVVLQPERLQALLARITRAGWRWTHGGRFHHIHGNNDKGGAVRALTALFERRRCPIRSAGFGDSLNDEPMLESVDVPFLISGGPAEWNNAVLSLLSGGHG
ncbi:MAG: HAD-IIB family hydrolase [Acidobacteria bacterium]|nr:HAD-IIB family hydrolase [Acidobacteriota bacterium]